IARKIRPLEFRATRPDRRPPGEPTRRLHWENPKAASRQNGVDQRQLRHQAPAERAAGSPASNARNLAGRAPRISQLGKESQSKTPTRAFSFFLTPRLRRDLKKTSYRKHLSLWSPNFVKEPAEIF